MTSPVRSFRRLRREGFLIKSFDNEPQRQKHFICDDEKIEEFQQRMGVSEIFEDVPDQEGYTRNRAPDGEESRDDSGFVQQDIE